jgi:hypothetical protein
MCLLVKQAESFPGSTDTAMEAEQAVKGRLLGGEGSLLVCNNMYLFYGALSQNGLTVYFERQ